MAALVGIGSLLATAAAALVWGRTRRFAPAPVDRPTRLIVVLGAALWDQEPCPELMRRLAWAAALHHGRLAPSILCSGGLSGGLSEAAAMRWALVRMGVPVTAIELDESGASTRRSVRAVARRVDYRERVIFVSSRYHMYRVVAEARRHGIDAIASPVPQRRRPLRQEVREVCAVCVYALTASPAWLRSTRGGRAAT
jgi:vancomycin permeability regulator SanA